jgi:23S rRNA (uracil1939-C5)-methyltransferase
VPDPSSEAIAPSIDIPEDIPFESAAAKPALAKPVLVKRGMAKPALAEPKGAASPPPDAEFDSELVSGPIFELASEPVSEPASESMPVATLPISDPSAERWQQGCILEVMITDLSDSGDGVGRFGARVVFVPDTVTGDRILVRLVRVKPQYAIGKLNRMLEPSPHRIRPSCIVADKCGGCQWQHVSYDYQLIAKQNVVTQALERIGSFINPPVAPMLADTHASAEPALATATARTSPLGYRNKSTYPLARSNATGEAKAQTGQVQAGYYQKGSHSLVNLNQCPIQDARLNPLLAEVKQDIQKRGWSIYNEELHRGKLRHLSLRIGQRTGEMLLTLVSMDDGLTELAEQAQEWLDRYPNLVGVALNLNSAKTNAIWGAETRCVAGQAYLSEIFAGLTFQIRPDTFFQVNTSQAEAVLQVILDELNLQGTEVILDAYCGIGTLTLPLAKRARQVIALEVQPTAVAQAQLNAELNGLSNVTFYTGEVEKILPTLSESPDSESPEIVVIDPPRKGCDRTVLDTLLAIQPQRIVYVSCNPATLARDLKILCAAGDYQLSRVQPADFFPQTAHVECVAFLVRSPDSPNDHP